MDFLGGREVARLVDSDSNTKSDKHQQPAAWSEDQAKQQ